MKKRRRRAEPGSPARRDGPAGAKPGPGPDSAADRSPGPGPTPRSLHRAIVAILFVLPFVFYWRYAFSSQMLFGTDWLGAGSYHWREFMAQYIRTYGNVALWWPAILSGQVTVAGFFADLFYPTTLFRLFLPVHVVWTWTFILHTFIAGLGGYLFLRELKLGELPAALAGVVFMFSGSLMTLAYAGHDGRLIGSALLPLALFFLHRGIARRQFVPFLLCGLVVALQLFSGHLQKVYYTGLMLLAYFLFEWVRTIRAERSAGLAVRLAVYFGVGMVFALALSAIQYLPVFGNMSNAARGAARGYDYAVSWSMPIIETFDLVTPYFSGGLWSYWSRNPFKLHSEYLGILPLLFALVAVTRTWKNRYTKFFSFSAAVGLLMAWGGNTPFYYIPYYLLPGISRIRGPAMIFYVAGFSLAALAAIGLHHFIQAAARAGRPKLPRGLVVGALVPAALLLLFAVAKGPMLALLRSAAGPGPQKLAALDGNYSAMVGGFLLATLVAGTGLLLGFRLLRGALKPLPFAILAAVVMTVDIGLSLRLWDGERGYIRGVPPPDEYYAPDEAAAFLRQDRSLFRVLPLHYEQSDAGLLTYHGIQSVAGQLPNPLQSYQDFIGAGQSVLFQPGNLMHHNFSRLLNVKYVFGPTLPEDDSPYDPQTRQLIVQLRRYFGQPWFELVHAGRQYSVYRDTATLPRAFVTHDYLVVPDQAEVIRRLMNPGFDPGRTTLLYEAPGFAGAADTAGPGSAAEVIAYHPDSLRVRARLGAPGLLVLSENYHPDWRAEADGRPVPVLRAYHTLRAVPLPTGEHEVVFRHVSRDYRYGSFITLAALAFLLATVATSAVRRRRRPKGTS